jgi:hypothetical protein
MDPPSTYIFFLIVYYCNILFFVVLLFTKKLDETNKRNKQLFLAKVIENARMTHKEIKITIKLQNIKDIDFFFKIFVGNFE